MTFLNASDRQKVQEILNSLNKPVEIVLFTQSINCEYCNDTEMLMKEIGEISDNLKVSIKNFAIDREEAEKYGIDRVPALVIKEGDKDYGIRFFGIPAGYEFASILEALKLVSSGDSQLKEDVREKLKAIERPMTIQVFVTPTCPYCPRAVLTAFQAAIENPNIKAHAVEVSEYPDLANKYSVSGVPKTVVDDRVEFVGAVPEPVFVENVLKAAALN